MYKVGVMPTIKAEELDYKTTPEHRLGEGAFGIVYRGKWRGINAAIKTLKASSLTPESQRDFEQEAEIHAGLRHPHIVLLYGAVTDRAPYCMVMELLSGSLYQLLHSDEALPWEERLRFAQEMGQGLDYLHSRKIIHRDLKSLNVLLDSQRQVKLSDFGLAKVKTETGMTQAYQGGQKGTIPWMAPELFKRRPEYSVASDTYAYAMTLWELASRKIPWQDAADAQLVIGWVKEGEREDIPANTPTVLREAMTGCWAAEPKDRPQLSLLLASLNSARVPPAVQPMPDAMDMMPGGIVSLRVSSRTPPASSDAVVGLLGTSIAGIASVTEVLQVGISEALPKATAQKTEVMPPPRPASARPAPRPPTPPQPVINEAQVKQLLQHVSVGGRHGAAGLNQNQPPPGPVCNAGGRPLCSHTGSCVGETWPKCVASLEFWGA